MKIYAIILVQDEYDILEHVLSNAALYCDFVCVYDTGSVDGSIEIAKKQEEIEEAVEVIYSENVLFHEQKTRRHALSLIKSRLSPGDWVIWLDADEFIGVEVLEFRKFLINTDARLIRHRHYNFGFTFKDLEQNPIYFKQGKSFNRNFYRHYLEFAFSEVKCMRWELSLFDKLLGGRDLFLATGYAPNRIPIIHYPYRNLHQMAKRLILRNLVMEEYEKEKFNKHWRTSSIKSFILDSSSPKVKELIAGTINDDFLGEDGRFDSRLSKSQVIRTVLKQNILKVPFLQDFLVNRKRNSQKDKLTDYEPIFKSKSFTSNLKRAYNEIDVNLIFNEFTNDRIRDEKNL
jgi:hypothetical protein